MPFQNLKIDALFNLYLDSEQNMFSISKPIKSAMSNPRSSQRFRAAQLSFSL